jgi:hypothetical protein
MDKNTHEFSMKLSDAWVLAETALGLSLLDSLECSDSIMNEEDRKTANDALPSAMVPILRQLRDLLNEINV